MTFENISLAWRLIDLFPVQPAFCGRWSAEDFICHVKNSAANSAKICQTHLQSAIFLSESRVATFIFADLSLTSEKFP